MCVLFDVGGLHLVVPMLVDDVEVWMRLLMMRVLYIDWPLRSTKMGTKHEELLKIRSKIYRRLLLEQRVRNKSSVKLNVAHAILHLKICMKWTT
jgi:hypothetical protein